VDLVVAGSSPVTHPREFLRLLVRDDMHFFQLATLQTQERYPIRQRYASSRKGEFAKLPRAFANSESDVTPCYTVALAVHEREFARRCARAGTPQQGNPSIVVSEP
jgi:hypothetical protein